MPARNMAGADAEVQAEAAAPDQQSPHAATETATAGPGTSTLSQDPTNPGGTAEATSSSSQKRLAPVSEAGTNVSDEPPLKTIKLEQEEIAVIEPLRSEYPEVLKPEPSDDPPAAIPDANPRPAVDANHNAPGVSSNPPTQVIFVAGLPDKITEGDLVDRFSKFGMVDYVEISHLNRHHAFVEFHGLEGALDTLEAVSRGEVISIHDKPLMVVYSKIKTIERKALESAVPSPVLSVTVKELNGYYLRAETFHKIACEFGNITKIVVLRRNLYVQALIEFTSIDEAKTAKYALNGEDIFNNSCSIRAEFFRENNVRIRDLDEDHRVYNPDGTPVPLPMPYGMQRGPVPHPAYEQAAYASMGYSRDRAYPGMANPGFPPQMYGFFPGTPHPTPAPRRGGPRRSGFDLPVPRWP